MNFYESLLNWLATHPKLLHWAEQLPEQINQQINVERWGDLPRWQQALEALPDLTPSSLEFSDEVAIGTAQDSDPETRTQLQQALMELHPWRKGPYNLFGLHIDTEWRSDWKWDRVLPHLAPLKDRLILDVGCGNGYHCWRMAGEGAKRVIGIDPSVKFIYQFQAIKNYALKHSATELPVDILPLGIEHLPDKLEVFDTVFSMGVLYHRRDPKEHIQELMDCLRPGGQLVLETLIIEGDANHVLVPDGRYAKMRNVWCIPTASKTLSWLEQCGLENARLVDINKTTIEEQRSTDWMTFESLTDFLDPEDHNHTIEGHPAPLRAVFLAEKAAS